MKWFRITLLLLAFLLTSDLTWAREYVDSATGTVTLSPPPSEGNGIRKVTIDWTSSDVGNATGTIRNAFGTLRRVVFNPGSTAPSANYDITLLDEDGIDILDGDGANLSDTLSSSISIGDSTSDGIDVAGNLRVNVSNAGDSKAGVIRLYLLTWR